MCIIDPYRRSEGGGHPGFTRSGNPTAAKEALRATSAVGVRMFHVKHLGGSCPRARHTPASGNPQRPRANTAPSYPHDTLALTRCPAENGGLAQKAAPRVRAGPSLPHEFLAPARPSRPPRGGPASARPHRSHVAPSCLRGLLARGLSRRACAIPRTCAVFSPPAAVLRPHDPFALA